MPPVSTDIADAALNAAFKLHAHLQRRFVVNGAVVGPDPSGRFNLRAGRFVKAWLPAVPWNDHWTSLQAMGYWVRWSALLARWRPELTHEVRAACDALCRWQRPDGAWTFKDPRRADGRVATFEGTWAALALLEGARLLEEPAYAEGARRWVSYLIDTRAFHSLDGGIFVTYWSDATFPVPNNSAEVLWLLAEASSLLPDLKTADLMRGLSSFLQRVQLPSGELPYRVPSKPHYLCFQYNAFEFLAIARYVDLTADDSARALLTRLGEFLLQGVSPSGACRTSCMRRYPEVDYYTAALALALLRAEEFMGSRARDAAVRALQRLSERQHPDGGFGYSRRDYGLPWLSDPRDYPRPQAIIGYCLAACAMLLSGGDAGRAQKLTL